MIDSHCHLIDRRYGEEPTLTPEQIIAAAHAAGVQGLVSIATGPRQWAQSMAIAQANPHVWLAAGLHPGHVEEESCTEDDLRRLTHCPKLVALGETGLDYHFTQAPEVLASQQTMFRSHLKVAQEAGLPVVVHTRDAEADTLAILSEFPGVPFVLHCFTASAEMAHAAVAMGGYISFSGVLTFKNSGALRALAAELPPERILIETDAPYLAPEPLRGRRCTPDMVVHTAHVLAACRSQSPHEIMEITAANTRRLFARMGAGA